MTDEGFEPLPELAPDPDEAVDAFDSASPVAVTLTPPPLGRAPAFDFGVRAIVPGDAGGPLMTRGRETLLGLVAKCLHTRRGECPAVDPEFGMLVMPEDVLDDGAPFDASAAAEYAAAAREALLRLPRASDVEVLTVECPEPGDALFVSGRLVTDDDLNDLEFELTLPTNAAS